MLLIILYLLELLIRVSFSWDDQYDAEHAFICHPTGAVYALLSEPHAWLSRP